jgi:hypothetical protein
MEIKFVDEYKTREVEKIGTVQCIRSEFDSSWEFPINEFFSLYQENLDGKMLYIVFNDKSGWYSNYQTMELSDKDFEFKVVE